MNYISCLFVITALNLSLYSHSALVDTLSIKDFIQHMKTNYGLSVSVKHDTDAQPEAAYDLGLRDINIVMLNDKYYLEATTSKAVWEARLNDMKLLLRLSKLWYYILAVGAATSGGAAWIRFDEMFRIYANVHQVPECYRNMHKTWAVTKFAVSLFIVPCIIKQFSEQAVFVDYLQAVVADKSRISGFKLINTNDTEVRIRTEFSIDQFVIKPL